jgi:hypothetical protein
MQEVTSTLFICTLFNDALSKSEYISSNERITVKVKLGRMCKEAVASNLDYCHITNL